MNVEELRTPDDFRRAAEEARARYAEAEAEWDAANAAYDQAYADWLQALPSPDEKATWKAFMLALARVERAREKKNQAFNLAARIYKRADEMGYSLWPEGPTEDVLIHRLADLLQPVEE